MNAYLVQCTKSHSTGSLFQQMLHSETLEGSAINNGQSMLAMLPTVLHNVEGLEIETLKCNNGLIHDCLLF